jgi:hypothetical protein
VLLYSTAHLCRLAGTRLNRSTSFYVVTNQGPPAFQVGFNNGVPITEEFYSANISGGHNDDLARALFPDMEFDKAVKFMDHKETFFRK